MSSEHNLTIQRHPHLTQSPKCDKVQPVGVLLHICYNSHRFALAITLRRITLLDQFTFIGVFLIVALIFGVAPIAIAFVLRPKKPNPRKAETYECGLQPHGEAWVQFKAQYYIFALVFVVFDVEAVFLLPWALAYHQLELYAVIEAIIFILILLGALLYVWRKNALEWM
ncbi:MAG: NADH-quinone oxidoreductase subunit A [Chloroflexi bacterium]|nr:NADH-quinone oxidoreductase subunit A [Chloroflexota bacterium]